MVDGRLLLLIFLIGGCVSKPIEIIDDLCYDDKNKTHLCRLSPEDEKCIYEGECKYA